MKKVLLVLMMLATTLTFAQENTKKVEKTLEETIQPYVEKLLEAAENGVKWGTQEIPIVIQQYIMFEVVYYALLLVLGFGFLTFIRRILINLILKKSQEDPKISKEKGYIYYKQVRPGYWLRCDSDAGDSTFEEVAYIFAKVLPLVVGFVLIVTNIVDFVKVAFFPKLYLVEKFIQLI